ncbi:MAG: PA14 domain-containing protein [Caldilineaceae bacterium]
MLDLIVDSQRRIAGGLRRAGQWGAGGVAAPIVALALLLAVAMLLAAPSQAEAQQRGLQVSSVQGILRAATGQPFATFLIDDVGRTFGLYGETPAIEQQITTLRNQGARVQVDGTLFPGGLVSTIDEIAVSRITAIGAPPPQPTPAPTQPTAVVNGRSVNVRSGPGTTWPVVGVVTQGTVCTVIGRNGDLTWLLNQCPGVQGWIDASLLILRGDVTSLPIVQAPPPPQPQPTPAPTFPDWKASYFNNPTLSGSPILVRNEPAINFRWGFASPATSIPVDNFSGRFESIQSQAAGLYNLTIITDDGARVWVDNQLVIDDWRIGSERQIVVQRQMPSQASVRIEYFESQGSATLVFTITPATAPPPPPPGVPEVPPGQDNWGFAYWNNTNLQGSPVTSGYTPRVGSGLSFNWGQGSPAPGVGVDNWSARFRGNFFFSAGDHTFTATSDDGVRVRINGITILDDWRDGQSTISNRFYGIGEGWHLIEVEFYERGGNALLQVGWARDTSSGGGSGGGGGTADQPVRDE